MNSSNHIAWRFFLSSLFISLFMITTLHLETSCSGGQQDNQGNTQSQGGTTPPTSPPPATPTPPPGPTPAELTLAAQTHFKDKVWPFLQSPRCFNCHDVDGQRANFITTNPPTHPDSTQTNTCAGCHNPNLLGFGPPPPAELAWLPAPASMKWLPNEPDPLKVRDLFMKPPQPGHALLWNHLIGEGPDKQPIIQWAFFDGPDTTANGGTIKAGAIPTNPNGAHKPLTVIPQAELLKWADWKPAIQQWICLELKVPGAPDLGKPANFTCP